MSDRKKTEKQMPWTSRFREWVSDNLIYMMLGLGILAVAAVIFFGVRFLSSALDKPDGGVTSTSVEATPTPTPETKEEDKTKEDAGEEIAALMERYYQALGQKDIDTLKKVVDVLSAEETAEITAEKNIEAYQEIETHIYEGVTDGTYVVLAGFACKYKEIDTPAPGLQQFYVYTDEQGQLLITAETTEDVVNDRLSEVCELEEVQSLIKKTQEAYQAARSSDAKLDALIKSVAGK